MAELVARGEAVRVLILPSEDTQSLLDLPVEIVAALFWIKTSWSRLWMGWMLSFTWQSLVSITPEGAELMQNVNVQGNAKRD